jgi:hypothetical protein
MATSFWATRNAAAVHLRVPPFLQMVVESPSIPDAEPGSDINCWKITQVRHSHNSPRAGRFWHNNYFYSLLID